MDLFKEEQKETVVSSCDLLGLSRQAYYRSIRSARHKQDIAQQVIALVKPIRILMPRLGTKKLYHILQVELTDLKVGRDKLFRILKANHMLIKPKRSYHVTTDSHHRFRKHKNLVCNIDINGPEEVVVSDITYVGNRKNPAYLALVTDAYSKVIMGHDVSNSLDVSGSIRAMNMAIKNRCYEHHPLIHHSDRGLQYCSNDYQELLGNSNIKPSMTEKYDPYENAIAERINGILKQEFNIAKYDTDLTTKKKLIKEAIKIYNNLRPHLSNQMLTPHQMHQQSILIRKTYKAKKAEQRDHCSALNN